MSSKLQLDVRNLSLGRRHLVNAYEVEAATVQFADKARYWSKIAIFDQYQNFRRPVPVEIWP